MRRSSVLLVPVVLGVSDVYMLKSVGDSTPPCGTPFFELALC